jgi:hypothetical protein
MRGLLDGRDNGEGRHDQGDMPLPPYYSLTRVRGEPGECRFDQSAIYTGGASLPHWQR